jgi:uncharacterized LabA/DUF88 family protein
MDRAVVLIDGGYMQRLLKDLYGEAKIGFSQLSRWAASGYELFRTYYYDCLPYVDASPTLEQSRRSAAKESFIRRLRRLDRYVVRLGRLARRGNDALGNPIFQQKRVDLQVGLDVASLATSRTVSMVVLVAGDSDLIPAVEFAREQNMLVRLVVPPRQQGQGTASYHQDLYDIADERYILSADVIAAIAAPAENCV